MNNKVTQPEEIDRALEEIQLSEEKNSPSLLGEIILNITTYGIQRCAYIPPYRAAYMRTHSLGGL